MTMLVGICGDTHAGYDGSDGGLPADQVHAAICAKFVDAGVNLVLNLGDHTHVTAIKPWETFDGIVATLCEGARYCPTLGNHENVADYMAYFDGTFPLSHVGPRYWIVEEGTLFVVLEVTDPSEAPPSCTDYSGQLAWLRTVLCSYHSIPLKCVLWHRPSYSTAMRGSDKCARIFNDTLKEYGVDVVLNGHAHAYERFLVGGVQYIVSGGAGGVPHPLNTSPDTATILPLRQASAEAYNYGLMEIAKAGNRTAAVTRFYDLDGNVLDELTLSKTTRAERRIQRTAKIKMESGGQDAN